VTDPRLTAFLLAVLIVVGVFADVLDKGAFLALVTLFAPSPFTKAPAQGEPEA
jgi:hypothetical protein